jgi:hypothetical protein
LECEQAAHQHEDRFGVSVAVVDREPATSMLNGNRSVAGAGVAAADVEEVDKDLAPVEVALFAGDRASHYAALELGDGDFDSMRKESGAYLLASGS